jgi:hypothetical protein
VSDRKIGDIADAHGVTIDLEDDDLITDVLVIAKVITTDGTGLAVAASEGMDWITQLGMIHAAAREINDGESE